MHNQPALQEPGKLLLTVDEAARLLSLGRSAMYQLILRKEVASIKIGKNRRIPARALQNFIDRLQAEGAR